MYFRKLVFGMGSSILLALLLASFLSIGTVLPPPSEPPSLVEPSPEVVRDLVPGGSMVEYIIIVH
jgi:hypothetical protein